MIIEKCLKINERCGRRQLSLSHELVHCNVQPVFFDIIPPWTCPTCQVYTRVLSLLQLWLIQLSYIDEVIATKLSAYLPAFYAQQESGMRRNYTELELGNEVWRCRDGCILVGNRLL